MRPIQNTSDTKELVETECSPVEAPASLSEQFLLEHRLGVGDSIEDFCARYPESREHIERDFPQLLELELAYQQRGDSKPAIPSKIGKYSLEYEIGRGGMGIVYAATHPDLRTDLALKVLPVGIRNRRNLIRFRAEARACAVMDHSHIVPVYDFGLEANFAYFVMRRIDGPSLAEVVAQGTEDSKLSWEKIAEIGVQAADALHYAHSQGVIHRDVKPANMMLDETGKLWLSDFGLAKLREDHSQAPKKTELTMTGELVGTARYMAPERFSGICTQVCDVYGLGLSLYELAAGSRVWAEVEDIATFTEKPALPDVRKINPAVPESLARIVMKACSFSPDERYQSAEELSYVLNRFVHGSSKADRRSVRNSVRMRWLRKDVLIGASLSLVTLAIVGVIVVFSKVRQSSQASAEQIVATFEKQLVHPMQDENGGSIFESDDPGVRAAAVEFVKALALKEIDASEQERQEIGQAFESAMQDYVESGHRTYVSKLAVTYSGAVWSKIPALRLAVEESDLSPEWKEYGGLLLSALETEDARRELSETDQATFNSAYEKLTVGHVAAQELDVTSESLRQFFLDLDSIQLNRKLKSLKSQIEFDTTIPYRGIH